MEKAFVTGIPAKLLFFSTSSHLPTPFSSLGHLATTMIYWLAYFISKYGFKLAFYNGPHMTH